MAKQTMLERLAEEELRLYSLKEKALQSLPEQIKVLEYKYAAIRAASTDATPISSGTNRREDALVDNIMEREYKTTKYREAEHFISAVNNALDALDERERLVLDRLYIHGGRHNLDRVMDELHLEKSQVYRIKDMAMYKFTHAYYGDR